MRFSRVVPFVACLLLLACKGQVTAPVATLQVRLDNTNGSQHDSLLRNSREFVWNHWHDKQSAQLVVTWIGKEGQRTDIEYDIRNIRPNTQVMVVTPVRYRYGYNGQVFTKSEGAYDVYTIERVEPIHPFCFLDLKSTTKLSLFPSDRNLSGDSYCLLFRGWGGDPNGFL